MIGLLARWWVVARERCPGVGRRCLPSTVSRDAESPALATQLTDRERGSTDPTRLIGLAAILVVAFLLRIYRLAVHDVWLDEAITLHHATTRSLGFLLFELPLLDPHPPLYFVLMKYWVGLAGTSESALRFPSVVFGLAAVPMFYLLVRELYDPRVAVVAATILAVSPFHVEYSQEARMYSLLALLTIASMFFFVRLLRAFEPIDAFGYVAVTACMGYTHVYGLFVLATQVGYLVFYVWTNRDGEGFDVTLKRWAGVQFCLSILLLPWVLTLLYRSIVGSATPGGWLPPPDLRLILGTPILWVDGVGLHPVLVVLVPVTVVGVVMAISPLIPRRRDGESWSERVIEWPVRLSANRYCRRTLLVVGLTVVPVGLGIVVSFLLTPIYYFRYTIVSSIGFYALVAVGLDRIGTDWVRWFAVAVLLLGTLSALPAHYAGSGPEPWEEVTSNVERAADADDLVIVSEVYKQAPFDYYWNDSSPRVVTVAEHPDRAVVIQERYERVSMENVSELVTEYDDVWLVLSHVSESHENELVSEVRTAKTVTNVSHHETITVKVGR